GTGAENLATINTATGVATVIGPYGPGLEGMAAIAFDAAGTLWGATANGTFAPALYTINPATGAATFVANITTPAAAPPRGGISALAFACNNTLYAGSARTPGAANGGTLGILNTLTGLFLPIGQTIADGSSLLDLSWQAPCTIVPTRHATWGKVRAIYR